MALFGISHEAWELELYATFSQYFHFHLQAKAPGRLLFDQVCKQLSLLEVDYFGLEYQDGQGITVRTQCQRLERPARTCNNKQPIASH